MKKFIIKTLKILLWLVLIYAFLVFALMIYVGLNI